MRLLLLILFLCGCGKSEPLLIKKDELIGKWSIKQDGIDALKKNGFKEYIKTSDHSIIIRSGGVCDYNTFATFFEIDSLKEADRYERLSKWELRELGKSEEFNQVNDEVFQLFFTDVTDNVFNSVQWFVNVDDHGMYLYQKVPFGEIVKFYKVH